jgi:hypothetical protein
MSIFSCSVFKILSKNASDSKPNLKVNEKIPQKEKAFDEVKVEIDKHLSELLAKTFINDIGT